MDSIDGDGSFRTLEDLEFTDMREIKFASEYDGRVWNVETKAAKCSNHKGYYKNQGYIHRLVTEHPFSDKRGYVKEHRLIMEAHLGRFLTKREIVHHKDQNRDNNDLSNLDLIDQSTHASEHLTGKRNPNGRLVASEPIFNEIKFRLLNKNTDLVEVRTLSELIGKTFRKGQFSFRGRFTGLADKNGRDIYEGDILEIEEKIYGHLVGFVMFSSGAFILTKNQGNFPMCKFEDCEIIGNIWENSDLLNKTGK